MYVVRDKTTKEIIHINNAPLSQDLSGEDIYYQFDAATMEVGKTDDPVLPEHYKFTEEGEVLALTTQELVEAGILNIEDHQKIHQEQIIEKPLSQQVAEGLITLEATQKIVETATGETIVEKKPSELLAENLIALHPAQKIVGEGENEQIVAKTLEEQVSEGILELGPDQRIVDNKIERLTPEELHDRGFIDLEEYKAMKIEHFSELSFDLREELIPEYKLTNASLGLYDETDTANITATIEAFRDEFYAIKQQIENATSGEAVQAVKENYPRSIVTAGA